MGGSHGNPGPSPRVHHAARRRQPGRSWHVHGRRTVWSHLPASRSSAPSLRPPTNIFSTHSAKGCASMVIGDEFSSKWLELLKEAVPNVSRVAILCAEAWIEGLWRPY